MPTFATSPLELLYWQRSLFDEPQLSHTARSIATALSAVFINSKHGYAWPSLRTLAAVSKSSFSSVKRAVKQLSQFGVLQVEPGHCERSNRYRAVLRDGAKVPPGKGTAKVDRAVPKVAAVPEIVMPAPEVTQPAPVAAPPVPEVAAAPESVKPAPEVTQPVPVATRPAPAEAVKPVPETPAPQPTSTAPEVAQPVPAVTQPAPEAAKPAPAVTQSAPETATPVPAATQPAPEAAQSVPEVTQPTPTAPAPVVPSGAQAPRPFDQQEVTRVLDSLNERAGTCFPSNPGSESHRITRQALRMQTPATLCAVIDLKASQWLGTERKRYLRPATLFAPAKLENYLSEVHQRTHQSARRRSRTAEAAANRVPEGATHPDAYKRDQPKPFERLPWERVNVYLDQLYQTLNRRRPSAAAKECAERAGSGEGDHRR